MNSYVNLFIEGNDTSMNELNIFLHLLLYNMQKIMLLRIK